MIEGLDRVVIAVNDLDQSLNYLTDLFKVDFDVVGSSEELRIRGAYSSSGLELIEPYGSDSFLSEYIKVRGESLIGIVLKVKDMDSTIKEFEEKGLVKTMDVKVGDMREVGFYSQVLPGIQPSSMVCPRVRLLTTTPEFPPLVAWSLNTILLVAWNQYLITAVVPGNDVGLAHQVAHFGQGHLRHLGNGRRAESLADHGDHLLTQPRFLLLFRLLLLLAR